MKIGSIEFDKPIILAPMEDVTGASFRIICKRLGADLVYTEFTSSEALIRNVQKALKKIEFTEDQRPITIQLFGGQEESLKKATKIVESYKPDFIDLNCGCWNRNHVQRGEGAGLLRDLPRLERIVTSMIKATHLPVTVKTRLGWDEKNIIILELAKMLEQKGVKAMALHCRTRSQGYKGQSDWSWLEKLKKAVSIPIIGNGDVSTPIDVKRMFETGCDGVMIGRGAISTPWIFQQTKHYLKTGKLLDPPPLKEKVELCIEHLKLAFHHKGAWDGVVGFRKHYVGYLKGLPNVARLRSDIMQLTDIECITARLYQFLEKNTFSLH